MSGHAGTPASLLAVVSALLVSGCGSPGSTEVKTDIDRIERTIRSGEYATASLQISEQLKAVKKDSVDYHQLVQQQQTSLLQRVTQSCLARP